MEDNFIFIREVGPREGFQSHSEFVPTVKKLELIKVLSFTGLQEIQVTSFVNPKLVPGHKDADELCRLLEDEVYKGNINEDVEYTSLFLNPKGWNRAIEHPILSTFGTIHIAANDEFLKSNMNSSIKKEINNLDKWYDAFGDSILMELIVSCAFSSKIEDYYDQVIAPFEGWPGLTIYLADTLGEATPSSIKKSIEYLTKRYPEFLRIGLHLHDGENIKLMDNVLAGLDSGVIIYDSSVLGVGGCPFSTNRRGNVATEKLVQLCDRSGFETGVDIQKYEKAIDVAKTIFYLN